MLDNPLEGLSKEAKQMINDDPLLVESLRGIFFENAHLVAEVIIKKKSVELATALQRELTAQLGIECKEKGVA